MGAGHPPASAAPGGGPKARPPTRCPHLLSHGVGSPARGAAAGRPGGLRGQTCGAACGRGGRGLLALHGGPGAKQAARCMTGLTLPAQPARLAGPRERARPGGLQRRAPAAVEHPGGLKWGSQSTGGAQLGGQGPRAVAGGGKGCRGKACDATGPVGSGPRNARAITGVAKGRRLPRNGGSISPALEAGRRLAPKLFPAVRSCASWPCCSALQQDGNHGGHKTLVPPDASSAQARET